MQQQIIVESASPAEAEFAVLQQSNASLKKQEALLSGHVIPACPLAVDQNRSFDERTQRALIRYYYAAGAGGLAVGVHTTQFEIRRPEHNLYQPLLDLVRDELNSLDAIHEKSFYRIAGACGRTPQAVSESQLAKDLGYDAVLLSLAALKNSTVEALIDHCREVADIIPVFGFYLQEAVGGQYLPFEFWREFCEIPNVVGIKIAPFNRYRTLDVMRAVAHSGRTDIALYTGNDDNILGDLLSPYCFNINGREVSVRMTGGLLGHWAAWTHKVTPLLAECRRLLDNNLPIPASMGKLANQITDANAAFFDSNNNFAGCIAGVHEVLRRQGFFNGVWLLDPQAGLSPGQAEEIDRVYQAYPHLNDDEFVQSHLDEWMS